MREIKFRGIPLFGNEFVFGSLIIEKNEKGEDTYTIRRYENGKVSYFEVKPESVGQYTGLKDKNGVEIYEGDILEAFDFLGKREIYPVIFIDGAFMGKRLDDEEFPYFYLFANKSLSETYRVIGNIYENPELLEQI